MSKSKHPFPPTKTQQMDQFFDDCFSFNIPNKYDHREWSRIDELKDIPNLVKKGHLEKASIILENIAAQYNDYDFLYAWQGTIKQKEGNYKAAQKIISKGLEQARSTHVLCERMGYFEFKSGNINDAVKWWIRSIVLMIQAKSPKRWEAFLYLAYVAKACESSSHHTILMNVVSQISIHGRLELESETATLINKKISLLDVESTRKAIGHLCNRFLKDQTNLRSTVESEKNNNIEKGFRQAHPSSELNQMNTIQIKPKPNRRYYIGFGIILTIIVFISIYVLTLDRPMVDSQASQAVEHSKINISVLDSKKQEGLVPPEVSDKIFVKPTINQIPKSIKIVKPSDTTLLGTVKKTIPSFQKTETLIQKTDTIIKKTTPLEIPEVKETDSPIDHKEKQPGLKLKTKSPKQLRIKKGSSPPLVKDRLAE